MKSRDARNLPVEALNERRRLAVRLRLAGMKVADVAVQAELSVPTVIAACKAYRAGGWDEVLVKPRGRSVGDKRALVPAQEAAICSLICSRLPAELDIGFGLWQRDAVQALVEVRAGVALPARTVGEYLKRWGFHARRPADLPPESLPAEARRWLKNSYPPIAEQARAEDAEVLWLGDGAVVVPGQEGVRLGMLRAVTNRGKLRWQIYEGALKINALANFLELLQKDVGRKLVLLSEGLELDRAAGMKAWLIERAGRFEIFPLPFNTGNTGSPGALAPARAALPVRAAPAASVNVRSQSRPVHRAAANKLAVNVKHLSANTNVTTHAARGARKGEFKDMSLTHLQRLEAESIHIIREVVAEADNPVMLYSIGKDSAVMLHLAMKAFYPAKPPFPLLHVDTRWKFKEMYAFRDRMVKELGLDLLVHINPEGIELDINPFTHGSAIHTDVMKTQGLKQALDKYGFDAAFGGARRDEEKSRAKERIFSFRSAQHRWDPKSQRPELWKLYNARKHKGESIRVFPISNWTELDIWQYIYLENIPIVPLYYSAERPVVERDGTLIMVDDERMPLREGEVPMMRRVRFRTLGCYPLTGAVESDADTLPAIIQEMLLTTTSERQGRVIDHDSAGSMEKKKQEGYF